MIKMTVDHQKKIVLTGGPCAGKTTLAQVIARIFENDVVVVPEAASMLFSGGFLRWPEIEARKATQRAVFRTQRELEAAYAAHFPSKILILDRGTVDGASYWPSGSADFFKGLDTTLAQELNRYDRVIYLESASEKDYLANQKKNPNRIESWEEAAQLDQENKKLWNQHSRISLIRNERSFGVKIAEVLEIISQEIDLTQGRRLAEEIHGSSRIAGVRQT